MSLPGPLFTKIIMIEDVFEEKEDISKTLHLTQDKMFKLGYRDGVISGKQASMQEGFDAGFSHASRLLVTTRMTPEEATRYVSDTKNFKDH
jgi:hypothetical protein